MTQQIFDRTLLRRRRTQTIPNFNNHDFLHSWASDQLGERLADIKREFKTILRLGSRGPSSITPEPLTLDCSTALKPSVVAEEDFLPFAKDSLDLILSNLALHSVNDLPGALIQINHALKPDGLFIAAMFGGETLHELRDSLNHAEIQLSGGLSPRVFPFADKQQMGGLMQRAGFALPIVDSDLITVTYPDLQKLFSDLRGMGESNIIKDRHKGLTSPALFKAAEEYYNIHYSDEGDKLIATFEIIFLTGWAPHASQQKPLRPGSAEHSLAEELGTMEIKSGDTVGSC